MDTKKVDKNIIHNRLVNQDVADTSTGEKTPIEDPPKPDEMPLPIEEPPVPSRPPKEMPPCRNPEEVPPRRNPEEVPPIKPPPHELLNKTKTIEALLAIC